MATAKSAAKPKSGLLSRPVIYTFLAGVAVYAYVLQTTGPAPSTHKKTTRTQTQSASLPNGITEEDLTAHFARYKGGTKDPFVPAVATRVADVSPIGGAGGQWALTGVNTVDGVTTASIENSSTNDSEFLKAGDNWNGLHVVEITPDSIVFVNALGQQSKLSFPGNDLTGTGTGSAPAAPAATASSDVPAAVSVPSAPRLPNLGLRPMPVPRPAPTTQSADAPANQQAADNGGDQNNDGQ